MRILDVIIPDAANLWLSLSAAAVLLLTPGPALLYIVGRSLEQGRLAGFVSLIGVHAGTLVHVLAAALGLSAVLASSALAFSVIKYAGAAYLIWLGLQTILDRSAAPQPDAPPQAQRYARLLRDGFIVNILNPKAALFFLAFLPQFVEVGRGHVAMQIVVLGLVFIALGIIIESGYVLAAGIAGPWFKRGRDDLRFARYVTGVLLIGLGLTTAFAGHQKT